MAFRTSKNVIVSWGWFNMIRERYFKNILYELSKQGSFVRNIDISTEEYMNTLVKVNKGALNNESSYIFFPG